MPYVATRWDSGGPFGVIFGNYLGVCGMLNNNSPANTNFQWSEIAFYAGASRQNAGLVAVAAGNPDVGTWTEVTDSNFTTYAYVISSGAAEANNRWFTGFNFGTPRTDIDGVRFGAWNTVALTPYQCDVIQSSDGANWAYVDTGVATTEPGSPNTFGGIGTFSMSYPDAGKHIYWRIAAFDQVAVSAGNRPLHVSGIGVYSAGVDVTSLATKSTTCVFTTGAIGDWFDGNLTTFPTVAFADIGVITFQFPSAIRINAVRFDAASGLESSDNYVHRCSLQYSDNGTDWTTAGRVAAVTYPGHNTAGGVIRLY